MEQISKIILGVDLQHVSVDLFQFAVDTARIRDAQLTVIYVHQNVFPLINVLMPKDLLVKAKEEGEAELKTLCHKNIPAVVEWESAVLEGRSVYEVLITAAKKLEAGLIIVGAHDKHQLDEILLGTNTEKIVRYAPCSVFVHKSKLAV